MSVALEPEAAAEGGLLDLRFALDRSSRTVLVERRQRFPLRTTAPLYLDEADRGMAFVYVQNPTGGTFGDDRLLLRVDAGEGTRVHVTTPSATKAYRMPEGRAEQAIELRVGAGAYVEYLPEPLIPQAGSRYRQHLSVELEPGGAFVGWEIVAPGRAARGELFSYEFLELSSSFRLEGRELCAERLVLEPPRIAPARRGLMGTSRFLGSLIVVAPHADLSALASELDAIAAGRPGILGGAGPLPSGAGVLARVLADGPIGVRATLELAWQAARRELTGLPLPSTRK